MIGPYIIVKKSQLPFIRDVHRIIKEHPEYADGIRAGVVHLAYNPGCKPESGSDRILRQISEQQKARKEAQP